MAGLAPQVDPSSKIATAVGQEYKRFIEAASGDLGPREASDDGSVAPLSAAPYRDPNAGPVRPARVEALPVASGGHYTAWQSSMATPQFGASRVVSFEIDDLLNRTLARSNQIAAFSDLPLIRETVVRSARGAYDPILFAEAEVNSEDNLRSSLLETGTSPTAPDSLDESGYALRMGIRQKLITGGEITLSQEAGSNTSNSEFFIPDPQSNATLRAEIRQPLLDGAGITVNSAPIQIAELEREQSVSEFRRQVETQLIEVIRAYWTLYQERGTVIVRDQLTRRLGGVAGALSSRQSLDALPSESAQASAALQRSKAAIVRARAGVRNAEARLASLLSDPSIFGEQVEIIPAQPPVRDFADVPLEDVARLALENRPELRSAALQLRAAEIRREVARNGLLPQLDAYASVYNGGLTDGRNLPGAVGRQLDQTDVDYAAGLRFELPLGNNQDRAMFDRRRLEVRQLSTQLRNVADTVLLEAQIGVRETRTAYEEMRAREIELSALNAQVGALGQRYEQGLESGSAFLAAYLQSLEQQTGAQERLLDAVVAYNLSLYTLERVAGTMLETRGIGAARVKSDTLDYIAVVRGEDARYGTDGLGPNIFVDPAGAARDAPRSGDDDDDGEDG